MIPSNLLFRSSWVPWRLARRMEDWAEGPLRARLPALYRGLHCGRLRNLIQPVTFGPMHHFFGYYDKSPWNRSGDKLLALRVPFADRPPDKNDAAEVGWIPPDGNGRFIPLGETLAWNWQQGCMLRWHPSDPDTLICHNHREGGRFVGLVRNLKGAVEARYERPFYAIRPDGSSAVSLNFSRLHRFRPGYGYPGVPDPWAGESVPERDGLWWMDLRSGSSELFLSLKEIAAAEPRMYPTDVPHWVNHVQFSPRGTRFAFLHRWYHPAKGWATRLMAAEADGTRLRSVIATGVVSHYDWQDEEHLLAWALGPEGRPAFHLYNVETGRCRVVGRDCMKEDGHCSFSPDGRWILNDTYPDGYGMRTLYLYDLQRGRRINLERFHSPARYRGETRCDLHPRWNRDGTAVCIDSAHTGSRQMYVVNLKPVL
ncbi:hypothetical protein SAMN02745206_03462 [Desulfacinum infernum DSM 9756]|uniref:WD40-like Beta Propeller Repeat n=1 Tax=Desulfacinum infernum DSM 9756 TaxID=1121391 RepID=A0A1M5HXZ5_9BACT|nr:hypothetical protein [Desulfacinum infernum]SHG20730.1 hypothetical protein SAMN02745206_03462 [Desulfacinum infernum DSM 9756]